MDVDLKEGAGQGEARLERSKLRERLKVMIERKMGPIVDEEVKAARALSD